MIIRSSLPNPFHANDLLPQYAERLPIGLESVIRHVDAATVKGFYCKWYRPERMAVVCVGDFADPDAVVATLQAALSTASAASSAPAPSLPKYACPGLLGALWAQALSPGTRI